jgi:hypothetical protein
MLLSANAAGLARRSAAELIRPTSLVAHICSFSPAMAFILVAALTPTTKGGDNGDKPSSLMTRERSPDQPCSPCLSISRVDTIKVSTYLEKLYYAAHRPRYARRMGVGKVRCWSSFFLSQYLSKLKRVATVFGNRNIQISTKTTNE